MTACKWRFSRTGTQRTFGYVSTGSAEDRYLQAGITRISTHHGARAFCAKEHFTATCFNLGRDLTHLKANSPSRGVSDHVPLAATCRETADPHRKPCHNSS